MGQIAEIARVQVGVGAAHELLGVARERLQRIVFAPRDGATGDLDGYYLTYATSPDATRSWLLVWGSWVLMASSFPPILVPEPASR